MKGFIKFLLSIIVVAAITALVLFFTGNQYLLKGVWATYLHGETSATITDKKYFSQRIITASAGQAWPKARQYNQQKLSDTLAGMLNATESIAFVVLKDDSLLVERYWQGFSDTSKTNSFSMAKSITAMLAQIAVQKGFFASWAQKVQDFLPALEGAYAHELQLQHLANMTAGLQWNEHYQNPFDITARAYYGPNIKKLMLDEVTVVQKPGSQYEYQSGATQLLGFCLKEATGKNLSQLASEWLWKPLGATHNATWHLDAPKGTELNYCCFNSDAKNFARFGQLILNQGHWQGRHILDSSFVQMLYTQGPVPHYSYSFWRNLSGLSSSVVYMRGILGQYVMVFPEQNMVVVRLGHKRLSKREGSPHPQDFELYAQEALKYFGY
jgi:CubicO group peptidase (beta-lactamase class C family)